jgi:hypothetical protein
MKGPNLFNPETNLLSSKRGDKVFHESRGGAGLARRLFASGTPEDLELGHKVIEATLACQEMREDDPHYGNFHWMAEDDWVEDLNAVEFCLEHLIPLCLEHGDLVESGLYERLLASMPNEVRDNTYVIFMGDNGSGRRLARPPVAPTKAKGTLYQGGINVPLFVTGPGVTKGVSSALVNSTDMFLTIMEMAGIDTSHTIPENLVLDSVSFMPYLSDPAAESVRDFAYADVFAGNFAGIEDGNYTVRNDEFKLFRNSGSFEFYNLKSDPFELDNLLDRELAGDEQAQYDTLLQRVTDLRPQGSTANE